MTATEPTAPGALPVLVVTALEAARILGMSREWVYDRIADGELRRVNLGTDARKIWRIRLDDLQEFIDSRTERAAS